MAEKINITVLVAPLDWGLGHATRCIPIITHLLQLGCKVIIATEGAPEKLLKTEFPAVAFVNLPGYAIRYSNTKRFFSLKIILQLPKILGAIKKEKSWLRQLVSQNGIDAIISDNRYGLYFAGIPSVFITHQLLIKAPVQLAEKVMQKINYSFIEKFTHCWVPDEKGNVNMSGLLSHPGALPKIPVEYLGGLSRLAKQSVLKTYDILVILSGPEPQRSLLEKTMLKQLTTFTGTILLVRGLPGSEEIIKEAGRIHIVNHLPAKELGEAFCKSDLIISRSGYTTVMDILKLQKRSVLIPTPGQTEQEYLAQHLQKQGWCIAVTQGDFSLNNLLQEVKTYPFTLPNLDMEAYKVVVTDFIKKLSGG